MTLLQPFDDNYFMKEAYKEALLALEENEIPIGAVVVCNNKIIARGHNQTERLNDVTAHAEMIAITAAANYLGSKYLNECDLYVTVEPCFMCGGAIGWAQLRKIVYGTPDVKKGFSLLDKNILHPKTTVVTGVMQSECEKIVQDFFKKLRD